MRNRKSVFYQSENVAVEYWKTHENHLSNAFAFVRNRNPGSHIDRLFGLSVDLYSATLITITKGM